MLNLLAQLALFASKAIIIVLSIITILVVFFALRAKGKAKPHLTIKHLNKKYTEDTEFILAETLPKKLFKLFLKERKQKEKAKNKSEGDNKKIYVLNFNGDIKASAVTSLREEVTAVLSVAKPTDEVVLRLESPGGMVHGYGLAAAQLMRIRAKHIPLTVTVDKIAASGGYMMACVANKILSAPFAIIGSIGVVVQLPNFHRLLKDKHVDFEQITAGEYKRTLTMFGENTEKGREKLQEEIDDMHQLFKNLIQENRQQVDLQQVATGEHWLGLQALSLKLVDEIKTSDEYLVECNERADVYEIAYEVKKPFLSKLSATAGSLRDKLFYASPFSE